MSIVSVAIGTQTATISTEHSLTVQEGVGAYVLKVDLANMASGDNVEIRVKTKATPEGASQTSYLYSFSGAQTELNWHSDPVPIALGDEITCTLTQTAGTGRSFIWNLMTV